MILVRFLTATAVAFGAALPRVYTSSTSAGQLAHTTPQDHHLPPRAVADAPVQGGDDVDTQLNVTIYNGQAGLLYAYVTALDPVNGSYHVLYHQGNGAYTWQVKPDGDSAVPTYFTLGAANNNYKIALAPGRNTSLYLPSYAASGRIYIANGLLPFGTTRGGPDAGFVQPSVSNPRLLEYNTSYQFVEFTYLAGDFYTDVSAVDFVAIPLGVSVVSKTGLTTAVRGLVPNAPASRGWAMRLRTMIRIPRALGWIMRRRMPQGSSRTRVPLCCILWLDLEPSFFCWNVFWEEKEAGCSSFDPRISSI